MTQSIYLAGPDVFLNDAIDIGRHAELFRLLETGQELRLPPGTKSPISEEDRRENRKQLDGRPLKDILSDLERLA